MKKADSIAAGDCSADIALTSLPAWADSADGRGNTIVRKTERLQRMLTVTGICIFPGANSPSTMRAPIRSYRSTRIG